MGSNESEQAQAIAEKLQAATTELMKQRSDWSEQMAIDCIMQAIKCGDFTRLLQGDKESYVYVPFQRESELQQKIETLQKQQPKRYTEIELKAAVFTGNEHIGVFAHSKYKEWLECARFLGMIKTEGE